MMAAGDKQAKKAAARRERARRRAICVGDPATGQAACPQLAPGLIKTCRVCNCPIALKVAGACPDNRW